MAPAGSMKGSRTVVPVPVDEEPRWRKNRKLVQAGFADLAYLPGGRCEWNATLAAVAYAVRRESDGTADLARWAVMHAAPASARYVELGGDGLVLWHGTSAARAEKIREHGLFHKGGLWTTLDPRIAHSYTRGRSRAFGSGSAMVCIVLDWREIEEGRHFVYDNPDILRFRRGLPADAVEYILWADRVEFVGERAAAEPKPWGAARFKRKGGRWTPKADPPVRFDDAHAYDSLAGWLELSTRRILETLGTAAAVEVFASLYATLDPWRALEHERVFAELERLCVPPQRRTRIRRFALREQGPG